MNHGFAAGCEARLCLAVVRYSKLGAAPLVRALPRDHGPKAIPGAQPGLFYLISGGA